VGGRRETSDVVLAMLEMRRGEDEAGTRALARVTGHATLRCPAPHPPPTRRRLE